jgi:hypothetical protein
LYIGALKALKAPDFPSTHRVLHIGVKTPGFFPEPALMMLPVVGRYVAWIVFAIVLKIAGMLIQPELELGVMAGTLKIIGVGLAPARPGLLLALSAAEFPGAGFLVLEVGYSGVGLVPLLAIGATFLWDFHGRDTSLP